MQVGLTHLSDDQLKRLLKAVIRKFVPCPLKPQMLMTAGLADVHDRVMHLRGLDEPAVRAVLTAVLAERRKFAKRT